MSADSLTPLEIEAINANAGMRGTMTVGEAEEAIRGILEHGLRHVPGTTANEERRFNDGYAFGLYRARDILGRVAASPSPVPASPDEWVTLANDIRIVDGNHDLGAGALAEALTARGWARSPVPASLVGEAFHLLGAMWSWNDAYLDDPANAHLAVVQAGRILRAALAAWEPPTTPRLPETLMVLDDAIAAVEHVGTLPFTVGELRLVRDRLSLLATGSEATPTDSGASS